MIQFTLCLIDTQILKPFQNIQIIHLKRDYWVCRKSVFGPASVRSYKIGVVGNNWLVGNAVFSETALRIFLIFCMKLVDYKGRKVTGLDFWKTFLIWRYWRKSLQISSKSDTLIFFSKTALTTFLVFGLELVLNMTFNLN